MPTKTLMMKDSNFDWMGDIPNTWQVKRLKYVMDNYDYLRQPIDASQRTQNGDILYDYYGASGVIDKIDDYICEGEKILIGEDGANLKMRTLPLIYIASGKYWVNNHAHILYPKNDNNLHFFAHQMESIDYENFITGSAQPKLSQENLNNVLLIEPPAYEQKAIAVFLDEKCEKIDKVTSEIEGQIQVLEDYKKSLITETVTKGLDKNVPMKNSGIDWIGQIPQNWNIKRLKYIGNARNGLTYEPEDMVDEDGILVLRSSNIQDNKLSFDDNVYVKMLIPKQLVVKENDLLICSRNGSRNLIGKCALIDKNTAGNSYGAFMCVFRSEYNRFIRYVLLSDIFNYYLSNFLTATINQLTNMQLGNIKAPIPPINVMKCIADYLDKECTKIDKTISDKKEQLETIKEYKKSLIYEYVTGKKRVAC